MATPHSLPTRPLTPTSAAKNSAYPSSGPAPLPPGWTEHKAPTGHAYYYHAATKTSTYVRPTAASVIPPPLQKFPPASTSPPYQQPGYSPYPHAQSYPFPHHPQQGYQPATIHVGGARFGPHTNHPRGPYSRKTEKPDRPKKRQCIPNMDPWVLVTTKLGRQFVHNIETRESLWKAPEDVQKALDNMKEMPKEELEGFEREWRERREKENKEKEMAKSKGKEKAAEPEGEGEDGEEYEEYEEEEGGNDQLSREGSAALPRGRKRSASAALGSERSEGEEYQYEDESEHEDSSSKRLKPNTDTSTTPAAPVEFTEEDIEWQLQAMADEYGLGEEDLEAQDLPKEDAVHIFKEMLTELNPNPYTTWDNVLPLLLSDPRYTVLNTTKHRQQVFLDWCKHRIAHLQAEKSKAPKLDPKVAFWEFLRHKIPLGGGKLYWQEFKRKWKKEPEMRDVKVLDKDREKIYREYVAHVKSSPAILENDLKKLLKSTKSLTKNTPLEELPQSILLDVRFAAYPPPPGNIKMPTREEVVKSYLATLPDAPPPLTAAEPQMSKAEQALKERERAVRREKMRLEREIEKGRELVEGMVVEVERAKKEVGRKGLASHLEMEREREREKEKEKEKRVERGEGR